MNRRPVIRTFLALTLYGFFASANGADNADQRAARYYAAGLEKPLLQLRAGAQLIHSCGGKLRKLCSAEQRELAAGFSIITLLDALTLFPQRLDSDPTTGISTARAFADQLQATSAALLREAAEYDLELFARVRAALVVCPAAEGPAYPNYLQGLDALTRVHYAGFQAVRLEKLAAKLDDQARRGEAMEQKMRAAPREDCEAARRLGEYLMQLMNSKLQPWQEELRTTTNTRREFDFDQPTRAPEVVKDDAWRARDRELAHAVAGNFVAVVATELQIAVYPESETPLKELTEAVELAKQSE